MAAALPRMVRKGRALMTRPAPKAAAEAASGSSAANFLTSLSHFWEEGSGEGGAGLVTCITGLGIE